MFSSVCLHGDWQVAMPNEKARKTTTWKDFVDAMKEYYKPTQNPTLKNFKFRELTQAENETFPAFCNRVEKEARHCYFKCKHNECNADEITTRDHWDYQQYDTRRSPPEIMGSSEVAY